MEYVVQGVQSSVGYVVWGLDVAFVRCKEIGQHVVESSESLDIQFVILTAQWGCFIRIFYFLIIIHFMVILQRSTCILFTEWFLGVCTA